MAMSRALTVIVQIVIPKNDVYIIAVLVLDEKIGESSAIRNELQWTVQQR